MDNPERRGNYGLLGGNSNNHSYFGLSCYFKPALSGLQELYEGDPHLHKEGRMDGIPVPFFVPRKERNPRMVTPALA
jgi:hypothetical protein